MYKGEIAKVGVHDLEVSHEAYLLLSQVVGLCEKAGSFDFQYPNLETSSDGWYFFPTCLPNLCGMSRCCWSVKVRGGMTLRKQFCVNRPDCWYY